MSENSERLAQSRLAILEHIQQRRESPGMIRSALNKAARATGFGRNHEAHEGRNGTALREAELESQAQQAPHALHAQHVRREAAEVREDVAAHTRMAAAEQTERDDALHPATAPDPATRHARRAHRLFSGRFAGLGEAGREYWHRHPARLAVELATPALSAYAQRRPVTYLAIAAGAGALIYLTRPWRLISVSGLAVAALRSPHISSALISALYGSGPEDAPPPPP